MKNFEEQLFDATMAELARRGRVFKGVSSQDDNLQVSFDSTTPINGGGGDPICLNGFAGTTIAVHGQIIQSYWYYDLGSRPIRRGTLTSDEEERLRDILARWDLNGARVPWSQRLPHCRFEVNANIAAGMFDWTNDASEIPDSVSLLVSALEEIIASKPEVDFGIRHFYIYNECFKPITASVTFLPPFGRLETTTEVVIQPGIQQLACVSFQSSVDCEAVSEDGSLHWTRQTILVSTSEYTHVLACYCEGPDCPMVWPLPTTRQQPIEIDPDKIQHGA